MVHLHVLLKKKTTLNEASFFSKQHYLEIEM